MGNSQSTHATGHDTAGEYSNNETASSRLMQSQHGRPQSPDQLSRSRSSVYGTIRRRISTRHPSTPASIAPTAGTEEVEGEREDRPLVHEGIQVTHEDTSLTASSTSLARSPSTVSRLGSRLLPDSVARVLLSSGEETPAEGRALRNGASDRLRSAMQRQPNPQANTRFSLTGSLRRRMDTRTEPRTDFRRHTIRGPFPLGATHQQLFSNDNDTSLDIDRAQTPTVSLPPTSDSLRRPTRLRRIRNSLSSPFSSLLQASQQRSLARDRPAPSRPPRVTFADDSDHLLPPYGNIDHRTDNDDAPHELDAVEPETRHTLSPTITSGMSTIRRFNRLRSRSTRLMRPENPPLSQVLQLAAAAIAAQLSGHSQPTANSGRTLGGEAFDDIQNFVQTLQEEASAQAGETIDVNAAEGDLPPVNFMRVFQFPNDEHGSPITSQAQSRDVQVRHGHIEQLSASGDSDRSVTLVLVGVRSMPHGQESGPGEHAGFVGPTLDNLLSMPFLPPSNLLGSASSGALLRRSEGRARGLSSRRHSMTNFSFPAQYESQRHQRTRPSGSFLSAEQMPGTNAPTPLSESPPGPHPPPSTPADIRSGQATPIRRPSSASAVHTAALPDLDENQPQPSEIESTLGSPYNVARQRRRSDSGIARRPELGSGAARRNGMVEPDPGSPGSGRSWLIYVVGTNVPPDHPAFTMPSLFTDNPSYEDMQMLSTLLGPVKPPVASREDVTTAGGLFRLVLRQSGLVAESSEIEVETSIPLALGERCLVCLSDYEETEEIRQLGKCQHMFHRECIDEVSHLPPQHSS